MTSKASKNLVQNLQNKDPNHPVLKALMEMSAFEQAVGSRTAFYHYPLNGTLRFAKQRGLIRERDDLVRLSSWGREVAYAACSM